MKLMVLFTFLFIPLSTMAAIPPKGEFLFSFGQQLDITPTKIAVRENGDVAVADINNQRVYVFDSCGNLLFSFTHPNFSASALSVAVNADGMFFCTAYESNEILVFDPRGRFLFTFGSPGPGDGQFNRLFDLAVNEKGEIITVEEQKNYLQVFDSCGNFLRRVGEGHLDFPNDIGQGVAVNQDGDIILTLEISNRVLVFDRRGNFRFEFDGVQFNFVHLPGINEAGHIIIPDFTNNTVEVFDSCGNFLLELKGGEDGFKRPTSAATNSDGLIFIANSESKSIQVYQ